MCYLPSHFKPAGFCKDAESINMLIEKFRHIKKYFRTYATIVHPEACPITPRNVSDGTYNGIPRCKKHKAHIFSQYGILKVVGLV